MQNKTSEHKNLNEENFKKIKILTRRVFILKIIWKLTKKLNHLKNQKIFKIEFIF